MAPLKNRCKPAPGVHGMGPASNPHDAVSVPPNPMNKPANKARKKREVAV